MGLGHSPRIVTDGLVLALDAQNSKSWKSGTTWTDTIGGNNGTLTGGTSHSDGPFPEAGYVEFDGSTEYLSIADSADFDMSSSIYTWELWFYTTDISSGEGSGGYGSLFSKCTASSSVTYGLGFDGSGNLFFKYWNGSGTVTTTATTTIATGQWYHVAVVKDTASATSGNTKIFVNGNLEATTAVSGTFYSESSNPLEIGRDSRNTTDYFQGYISNLRAVKGTALYTSNFTPPSSPLTAVTNTTLLCCQGGTNVDASPSAHTFQVIIGVPTLTSVGPSATKYFDFNGGYAVTSSNTDFLFGTEEFAMEWWEYFTGGTGYQGHIGVFQYGGGNDTAHIWTVGGSFYGYPGDWTSIAMQPISNQWAHYVVTGTSGDIKFYQNGELKDTKTWDWSATSSTSNFAVGGTPGWGWGNYAMSGKISAVRVYKGKSFTEDEVKRNFSALRGRYGI